ncbi:HAD family hydrolase [Succinivibrio sp.]|uniref:HAD family hydrolase n=1 Tax=Succinivibrio sp. TaxID=2053619 RepID=UPI003866A007
MQTDNKYSYIDGRRDLVFDSSFPEFKDSIKAVVFDLDGTLTDSITQIIDCTHKSFSLLSLPLPDEREIMSTIGLELSEGIRQLLPEEKKPEYKKITSFYREVYLQSPELQIDTLFTGVESLMKKIRDKGLKIGYASGRSTAGIKKTLDATILGDYCDAICGGSEIPKPNPEMMNLMARRLDVHSESILGVGDSSLDIKMFIDANNRSLGVQTGVWSGDALFSLKPDMILPSVSDLEAYIDLI